MNLQGRFLRFVTAIAEGLLLHRPAAIDLPREPFHRPIKRPEKIAGMLLILLVAASVTTQSQQPAASQQTTLSQQTAAGKPALPNPLTLSQAVTIALSNNSIVRQAQARLAQASGQYAQ